MPRNPNKHCTTYAEAHALLGSKPSRKLENNTYLVRLVDGSNALAVRLHATNVVTYHPDGRIECQTGGWFTLTTEDRLSKYTPAGLSLWSERGEWFICNRGEYAPSPEWPRDIEGETPEENSARWKAYEAFDHWPNAGPVYGFKDGATLNPDGSLTGAAEDPHASRKLLRSIRNYAAGYVAAFYAGQFSPSLAVTLISPEMAREFLGTGRYLPELLTAAMRYAGWTDYRRAYALSPASRGRHYAADLRAALRRYLYGILGLPGGHRPAVVTTAPGSLYGAV